MRINMVTGGKGFIGTHLVRLLAKRGEWVCVYDLQDGNDVRALTGNYDNIYHLASPVGPVGILSQSGDIAGGIIGGIIRVLEVAQRHQSKVLYVSSSEVYGPRDDGKPLSEEMACTVPAFFTTRLEYGVAKLCGEILAVNFAKKHGVDLRIVRLFNTIGIGQDPAKGFVVARFMEQAKSGKPITVYGEGYQIRTFTDVRDVVRAIVHVMEYGEPNECYNVGNPDNTVTILGLAEQIKQITGSDSPIIHVDPKDLHGSLFEEAWNKVPSIDKIQGIGWKPLIPLYESLRSIFVGNAEL